MEQPRLTDIEQMVEQLVLPFYAIERDMDMPLEDRRKEYDSEHAWSVSLVACSLAAAVDPELDLGLLAQLGIVHDLVEVYAGDTSIWASKEELGTKEEREAQAIQEIKDTFEATFPWIPNMVETYERKDTNEALFLWSVDKLLPMIFRHLDGGRGYRDMKMTKERFNDNIGSTAAKARSHPVIAKYWDEIIDIFNNDPGFFYSA